MKRIFFVIFALCAAGAFGQSQRWVTSTIDDIEKRVNEKLAQYPYAAGTYYDVAERTDDPDKAEYRDTGRFGDDYHIPIEFWVRIIKSGYRYEFHLQFYPADADQDKKFVKTLKQSKTLKGTIQQRFQKIRGVKAEAKGATGATEAGE